MYGFFVELLLPIIKGGEKSVYKSMVFVFYEINLKFYLFASLINHSFVTIPIGNISYIVFRKRVNFIHIIVDV